MHFLNFFLFLGGTTLTCLDPDPDRLSQLKPDPDPKHCFKNKNFLVAGKPGGGLNGWSPS
jgi:hypothetical protein